MKRITLLSREITFQLSQCMLITIRQRYRRTDGQTDDIYDSNTTLRTHVLRAVKSDDNDYNNSCINNAEKSQRVHVEVKVA